MQQDEVHGLCRVALQLTAGPIVVGGCSAAAAKAASFRRWRRRAGTAQGAVPQGRCVWVYGMVDVCGGSALVASSRGNGCVSLAMPFFVLCTRIELLFPCSFVPLSAVPWCFAPAVFSFVRWFTCTVFGFLIILQFRLF